MRAVPQFSISAEVVPDGRISSLQNTIEPCGSELARDGVSTFTMDVD
jgi:hypothetical protein